MGSTRWDNGLQSLARCWRWLLLLGIGLGTLFRLVPWPRFSYDLDQATLGLLALLLGGSWAASTWMQVLAAARSQSGLPTSLLLRQATQRALGVGLLLGIIAWVSLILLANLLPGYSRGYSLGYSTGTLVDGLGLICLAPIVSLAIPFLCLDPISVSSFLSRLRGWLSHKPLTLLEPLWLQVLPLFLLVNYRPESWWIASCLMATWLLVSLVGSFETYWQITGGPALPVDAQPDPGQAPDFPASLLWRDVRHIVNSTAWVWLRLLFLAGGCRLLGGFLVGPDGRSTIPQGPFLLLVYASLILIYAYLVTVWLVAAQNSFSGGKNQGLRTFLVNRRQLAQNALLFSAFSIPLAYAPELHYGVSSPWLPVLTLVTAITLMLATPFAVLGGQSVLQAILSGFTMLRQRPALVVGALLATMTACYLIQGLADWGMTQLGYALRVPGSGNNDPTLEEAIFLSVCTVVVTLFYSAATMIGPMLFVPISFCLYWRLSAAYTKVQREEPLQIGMLESERGGSSAVAAAAAGQEPEVSHDGV